MKYRIKIQQEFDGRNALEQNDARSLPLETLCDVEIDVDGRKQRTEFKKYMSDYLPVPFGYCLHCKMVRCSDGKEVDYRLVVG